MQHDDDLVCCIWYTDPDTSAKMGSDFKMPKKKKARETTDEMTFGEILQHHRAAQKYSLRDFSAVCGVSASYLSRLEKGEASATYEVIIKIADALGIPPAEFFPGHGGFSPSFRKEFGKTLESRPVQLMMKTIGTLDPYSLRAVAVATIHMVEILKRGLHPVVGKDGTYELNREFIEELEYFKGFKSPKGRHYEGE